MFGQRKRLRRWAAQTLLVWLFALVSSAVHACGIEVVPHQVLVLAATGGHHGAAPCGPDADGAGHEPATAHASACAKFCADEPSSVPVYKQQADLASAIWLAGPPSLPLAAADDPDAGGVFSAQPGLLRARVPIPIAFLRLTL